MFSTAVRFVVDAAPSLISIQLTVGAWAGTEVTVRSAQPANSVSSASSRTTYVPGTGNDTEVDSVWVFVKVAAMGPVTCRHPPYRVFVGTPSSLTAAFSLAAVGKNTAVSPVTVTRGGLLT